MSGLFTEIMEPDRYATVLGCKSETDISRKYIVPLCLWHYLGTVDPMGELKFQTRHEGGLWDPEESDIWWETTLGDWILALRLVPQQGHAVVGEVRLFPAEDETDRRRGEWSVSESSVPAGGLLSKHLDEIRLTGELLEARERLREEAEALESSESWHHLVEGHLPSTADVGHPLLDAGFLDPGRVSSTTPAEERPGRRGHSIEWWLNIAVAYHNACRSRSRHPNKDVAAAIHGIPMDEVEESDIRQAAEWVRELRKKGLLGPAPTGGKAGGGLTEKAKRLLQELEEE